jgi:DNA-binding transcriptional LysR family regulator
MDIRQLRYLIAAVECGSMLGAADRMNVSQPALSRSIRSLELEFGCDLLVRNPRGVTPTPAGEVLYRRALAIMDDLDDASQTVRRIGREQAELVHLGLVQTSRKLSFLRDALSTFDSQGSAGGLRLVRASSADLSRALREGRLEISLLYEHRLDLPGFRHRPIHAERYVLAIHPSHPLAIEQPARLADFSGEPLVWFSRGKEEHAKDLLLQQCRLQGLQPIVAHTAGSFDEQIDLVMATSGVCLTPALTMLSVPPGSLVFRPLPGFEMTLMLSLAWHEELGARAASLLGQLHAAIDRHQAMIESGEVGWASLMGVEVVRSPPPTDSAPF